VNVLTLLFIGLLVTGVIGLKLADNKGGERVHQ